MVREVETVIGVTVPHLQNTFYLRDDDRIRDERIWQKALIDIRSLAQERKLTRKVFISYAWPTDSIEKDELQQWA